MPARTFGVPTSFWLNVTQPKLSFSILNVGSLASPNGMGRIAVQCTPPSFDLYVTTRRLEADVSRTAKAYPTVSFTNWMEVLVSSVACPESAVISKGRHEMPLSVEMMPRLVGELSKSIRPFLVAAKRRWSSPFGVG